MSQNTKDIDSELQKSEPVNKYEWLDEILNEYASHISYDYMEHNTTWNEKLEAEAEAKQAITSKLESIEQEAYKKGYIAGGIEAYNEALKNKRSGKG